MVNLWASWCTPCKKELPILARLDAQAGDRLTVLGVDYQDPAPRRRSSCCDGPGSTTPSSPTRAGRWPTS